MKSKDNMIYDNIELLAPAGSFSRMKMAINYGANAVYLAGKSFGLRAMATNFTDKELKEAVEYAHSKNVKVFVTVNILAKNEHFKQLKTYLKHLEEIKVDAVIVSDLGILKFAREHTKLKIHISTQASVLNKYAAEEYIRLGAERIILARECTLGDIKEISQHLKEKFPSQVTDIECFVHGAMCVSYSGRCLLSNYLTARGANQGACVQACRWNYILIPENKEDALTMQQDENGTYILNSKDLAKAGVTCFKVEGRMKSEYYVASVINCYNKALDALRKNEKPKFDYLIELEKTSHRQFGTGFLMDNNDNQFREHSRQISSHEFVAVVLKKLDENKFLIEQRNRFRAQDTLEILSPNDNCFNKTFKVGFLKTQKGETIIDAKNVQEKLIIECELELSEFDILRKKLN